MEDRSAVEERYPRKRLVKLTIFFLKIIPMLLALCAALNMLFDFFGINSGILSVIGGMSVLPLIFLYLASYAFQFCAYHRMFLHYILANDVVEAVDTYIGIPVDNVTMFMLYLALIGLFLFLVLYLYRKERCCKE